MAWLYGFHPTVHYAYCTTVSDEDVQALTAGTNVYPPIAITLGGPLQTTLTGMVGLIGLWIIRRKETIDAWNTRHLLFITLAFFHSREVFNTGWGFLRRLIQGPSLTPYRGARGDETHIFQYYGINQNAGHMALLIIFSAVLAYVTFILVKRHRLQLIVFGGAGAFAGGLLWLLWLGPVLMP